MNCMMSESSSAVAAYHARLERLASWDRERSFGAARLEEDGLASPPMLESMALIEALSSSTESSAALSGRRFKPSTIDRLASGSYRLIRIERDYQVLRRTSSPVWITERGSPPDPARVRAVDGASWAGKPVGALFTSEATECFPGMWRAYLATRRANDDGPLSAWTLRPSRHSEIVISSAQAWCELVVDMLTPADVLDWRGVAERVDAVRITPRGLVCIDGIEFEFAGRRVPPIRWTVESTMWLRWTFDSVAKVKVASPAAGILRAWTVSSE